MFSAAQEAAKMISWQQEDITKISMHMDAVSELTMDTALYAAKEISKWMEDGRRPS